MARKTANVFYIDFGNEENVTLDNIRPLSDNIDAAPPFVSYISIPKYFIIITYNSVCVCIFMCALYIDIDICIYRSFQID